jgi:DNA-binding transcriptional regulator YiaG
MTKRKKQTESEAPSADVRVVAQQVARIEDSIGRDEAKLRQVVKDLDRASQRSKSLVQRGKKDAALAAELSRLTRRQATIVRRLGEKSRQLRDGKSRLRHARNLAAGWDRAFRQFSEEWRRSVSAFPKQRLSRQSATVIAGEQLRAARMLLRMPRRKFARLLGVSEAELGAYERSRGPIDAPRAALTRARKTLRKAGIELIAPGVYVGSGGFGVRLIEVAGATDNIVDLPRSKSGGRRKKTRRGVKASA